MRNLYNVMPVLYKINKFLTVGLNAQFVQRDASAIGADWVQYQKLTPYGSPTNEDGTMKLNPGDDTSAKHPLIDSYYTDKRNVINNLNANIYAKVSLPFNISYQMNFSPRYEWATDMYINLQNIQAGKILGALLHELLEMIFYGNLTI